MDNSPPYGNLSERSRSLGQAIVSFANYRAKVRPERNERDGAYNQWLIMNDGLLRFGGDKTITKICKELSDIHVADDRLDELLETAARVFQYRNGPEMNYCIANPEFAACYLSLDQIREIGERFIFLSSQIPNR